MTENPNRKEAGADRDPFIIRGHHAKFIARMLKSASTPEMMGRHMRISAENATPLVGQRINYTEDVLGNTIEQANAYELAVTSFFRTFLELPPDHPVKLVADQKDGICEGCAVGKHCETLNVFGFADEGYINAFVRVASKMGLKEDIATVEETATYLNAEPNQVESVLTTAVTAQKVLADKRFRRSIIAGVMSFNDLVGR